MKVLFIRSNPCQPDVRVEKELQTVLKLGHSVEVFCWDRDNDYLLKKETKSYESGTVVYNRTGIKSLFGGGFKNNLKPLILFQIRIAKFLSNNKYDIIHACDFDTGLISYIFKKKSKFIYDVFDYYVDSFSVPVLLKGTIERAECYICNNCDALILCTEERKKQIRKLNQKKIYYIHNSPKPIYVKKETGFNNGKLNIVYVGVLGHGRMIIELLNVCKNNPQFILHIGGVGILSDLVQQFDAQCDNIIFYGKLEYIDTLTLENKCDVILALYETHIKNHIFAAPNKFYEGLYLGKPLIMIKGSGMSKIVQEKSIGILINHNEKELEDALYQILKNINKWKSDKERIRKIYEEDYSWNAMDNRLGNLYKELI